MQRERERGVSASTPSSVKEMIERVTRHDDTDVYDCCGLWLNEAGV